MPIPQSPDRSDLVDALYELQSIRERTGIDSEPAVVPGVKSRPDLVPSEVIDKSSVFIDRKTGTRIVMTNLPLDQADFTRATLWLSNPGIGIDISGVGFEDAATLPDKELPRDVIFLVGGYLTAMYLLGGPREEEDDSSSLYAIDDGRLSDFLSVPKGILPVPQSEEDARNIPDDLEYLRIPTSRAYTLAAAFIDDDTEAGLNIDGIIARRSGVVNYGDIDTTFDLQIAELSHLSNTTKSHNKDLFDREIEVVINTGQLIGLKMTPYGKAETSLTAREFMIRVYREGIIFLVDNGSRHPMPCVPAAETAQFVNQVLLAAQKMNR